MITPGKLFLSQQSFFIFTINTSVKLKMKRNVSYLAIKK